MPAETVELNFVAKIQGVLDELKRLDPESAKEAKKITKNLTREFKRSARESAKLRKALKRDIGDEMKGVAESAKQAATAIGGSIGGIGGQVEAAARSAGALVTTLGPGGAVVAAVAATAAGVGALTLGINSLVESSDAARSRLEELSGVEPIPQRAIDGIDDWKRGALAAEAASLRLRVILAGELGAAFVDLANFAAGAVGRVEGLVEGAKGLSVQFQDTIAVARTMGRVFEAVATLGLTEIVDGLLTDITEEGANAAESIRDLAGAFEESNRAATSFIALQEQALLLATGASEAEIRLAKALEEVDQQAVDLIATRREAGAASEDFERAVIASSEAIKDQIRADFGRKAAAKEAADAERDAARAAREREAAEREAAKDRSDLIRFNESQIRDLTRAQEQLEAVVRESTDDQLDGFDRINRAFDERIARIAELEEVLGDADMAAEARAEAEQRRLRDTFALIEEEATKANKAAADAAEKAAKESADAWEEAQAEMREGMRLFGDAFGEVAALIDGINESRLNTIETLQDAEQAALDKGQTARADALAKQRKAEEQAALTSWRMSKALGLIEVGIATTVATMTALAQLGPIAGAIAAVGIVAGGAAAAATIAATPPPEFPTGRLPLGMGTATPDHQLAGVRADEAILTPAATAAIGGVDAAQALNDGRGMVQPSITLQLGRRVVGRVMGDRRVSQGIQSDMRQALGIVRGRVPVYGG